MNQRIPGLTALFAFSLLSTLPAQDAKLDADVELIRGLVNELKFIPLAQYEVDRLKKVHKDSAQFKRIAQLAIDVALQGAKRHPDRSLRGQLFSDAVTQLKAFIERYDGDPVALEARVTLSDACIEFGYFLNQEIETAREEEPGKVADLEEQAAEVFRLGVETTNITQKAFQAKSTRQAQTDAFVSWMRRGILYREHGRAVKKDRKYLTGEALSTFEDLIFEVGEETILGQKALFEMSKVEEVRGDFDAAITAYNDAIGAIWESLESDEVEIPEAAQRIMFNMMQEIFDSLASATYKAGRGADIEKIVKTVDERIKKYDTEPDPRWYDSMLITKAQADATSGSQSKVSEALTAARAINKRHPADYVGLRAKKLIADILRSSADLVTGELLLQVAIGDYQNKNYEAAAAGFKRALGRMDGAARAKHGFDTWIQIARCNEKMKRNLEAALAYSRAMSEHGNDIQASEDDDAKRALQSAAKKATTMVRRVMTASKQDPIFTTLNKKIESQLQMFDPDAAAQGDYAKGLRLKIQRKYVESATKLLAVQTNYPRYELALGHAIDCQFRAGKYADAKSTITKLRQHVAATTIPEDDRERRGYRPQALAWAAYAEARMLYEEAKGGKDSKPDLTKFKDVEKKFLEFESVHLKHSQSQVVKVNEVLGHAYLEMGDEAKAAERYSKLKALGETTPDAHKGLGILMFNHFRDQAKALQAEIASLIADKKNPKATADKLTAVNRKALDMGIDYAKTVGKPAYAVLYNTMRIGETLEDWPKTEWAAEKILKLYGKAKYGSLIQVKPVLGFAKLRQPGRMQEALEILNEAEKELGARDKKTSAYYEVLRFKALALGGWPAFDKAGINYEPNPGMSKPDEAFKIFYWDKGFKNWALHSSRAPAYSLKWYQYHLEVFYFCRQAERIDTKFKTRGNTFYNKARATDDFKTLKALGVEGQRLFNLFQLVK